MEKLKGVMKAGLVASFNHVIRKRNKVVENLRIENRKFVKEKDWDEVMDATTWDNCVTLTLQDMRMSKGIGRGGH